MSSDSDDSTPHRLTEEEVERYLLHLRDSDAASRDRLRKFLISEHGWEIINALRQQDEAKQRLRDLIASMKAGMLGTNSRIDFVYVLVGEFIVKFSQVEYWLRFIFYTTTNLEPESADPILAQIDFRALVGILTRFYVPRYIDHPDLSKRVRGIFSQCLALNNVRNQIAHGTWFLTDAEMKALHLSRQKMQWQAHFPSREELKVQIAKLDALDAELRKLLSGDNDPPDDDC